MRTIEKIAIATMLLAVLSILLGLIKAWINGSTDTDIEIEDNNDLTRPKNK